MNITPWSAAFVNEKLYVALGDGVAVEVPKERVQMLVTTFNHAKRKQEDCGCKERAGAVGFSGGAKTS